jgi:uncharacterized SAM-binding protein YcdF (DUF218 family)
MIERPKAIITTGLARLVAAFWRACALFTLMVFMVAYTPVSNRLAAELVVEDRPEKADLIVVLGGGANRIGTLSGASNERLIHGLRLFKAGYAPLVYFAGGTIIDTKAKVTRTITGNEKSPDAPDVVEAAIMKDVAVELGMSENALRVDALSSDTHENFVELQAYMEKTGVKTCLVVTSPTHAYRAQALYHKLGLDCSMATIPDYTGEISSFTGRVSLMRAVMWEFSAIALYRVLGYI